MALQKQQYIFDDMITQDAAEDIIKFYSKLAPTYEEVSHDANFRANEIVASKASAVLPKDAYILDCPAGTGMVAEQLHGYGFRTIDALDGCDAMLNIAREKKIYQRHMCCFMGRDRFPVNDDTYDGVTMAGAFVPGHLKGDCLLELIRVTKPGGKIVITFRGKYLELPEFVDDVIVPMQRLEKDQVWKLLEREETAGYVKCDADIAVTVVYEVENNK